MYNLGDVTVTSTKTYLLRKKELETSIGWYVKTIDEIDKQQDKRKQTLRELQDELYNLERDYYGA